MDASRLLSLLSFSELLLLRDRARASQMAMMLITHDLGVIAQMAEQVVVMYAGRIVEQGATAEAIAREVVLALGGYGLFGVELFVCGDEVIFSEVSPRPHDTGMVTLISQDLSEFALHVRAFLGLPVGAIRQYGPAASAVILPQLSSQNVSFGQLQSAVGAGLQLRLFGKPEIDGTRRLGVTLAVADSVEEAVARAKAAAAAVIVEG